MGRPLDLFAAASPEGAWSVSQVTRRARAVVEAGLPPLWVRGEVSGFKAWQSGHWYFALRDKAAQLRCVMFGRDNRRLSAPPSEGLFEPLSSLAAAPAMTLTASAARCLSPSSWVVP